jgi:hypothetical protein
LTLRLGGQQRDASLVAVSTRATDLRRTTCCNVTAFDLVHASEDTSPDDATAKPFHPKFTYPVAYSESTMSELVECCALMRVGAVYTLCDRYSAKKRRSMGTAISK